MLFIYLFMYKANKGVVVVDRKQLRISAHRVSRLNLM